MTFEQLDELRFYIRNKIRQDRIAANNSKLNGYKSVALEHENAATLGEKVLQSLVNERGIPVYAR